jgi:predicted nucleic acid-binding protein
MVISIDTNVWIFGLTNRDGLCRKIITNLAQFEIILPNQVRAELQRNLSTHQLRLFYQLIIQAEIMIDFESVPNTFITEFERKGLKKGDAEIGAFCEWRGIDILISDNRDFLKGLSPDHNFQVLSPAQFRDAMGL